MDIKALQFESRFSLPPNSLGYCGRDTAPEKFKKCIADSHCKGVEEEVKNFIVLYPYLKTIAKIAKLPVFSYQVFESYWIGNDLLKKVKSDDYESLLTNFGVQGVPDFFIEELRQKKPKLFIPTHLFQVLHIGVGKASGVVPFNLDSINNCMIRWGKVTEIKKQEARGMKQGGKLKINLISLKQTDKKYELFEKDEIIPFNIELVPGLEDGDYVAVHWDMIIKILTKGEVEKLEYWTRKVIDSIA